MNVKESLIRILENHCPDNVYLQGTLNPDEVYPQTFITFFITTSEFNAFYDNDPSGVNWYISVMVYSADPDELSTISIGVLGDCRNAGFIPESAGNDIPSDVETHTGWAMDFIYQEFIY